MLLAPLRCNGFLWHKTWYQISFSVSFCFWHERREGRNAHAAVGVPDGFVSRHVIIHLIVRVANVVMGWYWWSPWTRECLVLVAALVALMGCILGRRA